MLNYLQEKLFRTPKILSSKQYSIALEHQRSRDLFYRQFSGIIFYPLSWLLLFVVFLLGDFPAHNANLSLVWLVIFIGIAAFRYLVSFQYKQSLVKPSLKHSWYIYFGILLSASSWGLMAASALFVEAMRESLLLIFVATFALCSGGIISLSISKPATLCFLAGMLLPLFLATLIFDSILGRGFSFLILFYFVGIYSVASLPKREYELMVISNLKLSEQTRELTELSMQDALTGINNRRYFNDMFTKEVSRASRQSYSLVLLLIDIDYFKRVNDEFGHLVGDSCLIRIAELLAENAHRKTDILARYGGEEFILVLTNIAKEDGIKYAEQLRASIEKAQFEALQQSSKQKGLTISIGGVSLIPDQHSSPEKIIKVADDALYQAKSNGRNQVCWQDL